MAPAGRRRSRAQAEQGAGRVGVVAAQPAGSGEGVQQAILLGCVRKSMSLIDRPTAQSVRRLRYFEPLLRKVERERFPAAYWQRKPDVAPGRARPKKEQARSGTTVAAPSKVAANTKGDTR